MVSICLLRSVDLANSLLTNKISMRAIINRVPVPRHVRFPVCPPFMVLTGQHNIPVQWNKNSLNKLIIYIVNQTSHRCTQDQIIWVCGGVIYEEGELWKGTARSCEDFQAIPPQVIDQSVNMQMCGSRGSKLISSPYCALLRVCLQLLFFFM